MSKAREIAVRAQYRREVLSEEINDFKLEAVRMLGTFSDGERVELLMSADDFKDWLNKRKGKMK
jgi:Tfp pilus assembly protein PilP